ncbi:trypsin-like peptidase domain-containing protein [Candidatus Bathyarchaeota archaeon]|nr:trypsin-like peptidase domain-containing protein [Candidatus Bathyarchaeota archaeon]
MMRYLDIYEEARKPALLTIIVLLLTASLFIAGFIGYMMGYRVALEEIDALRDQIQSLRQHVTDLQNSMNTVISKITVQQLLQNESISLSEIYEKVKDSVVLVRGFIRYLGPFGYTYEEVQGSGFIYNFTGQMVIITNYHVVYGAVNITVTFSSGNAYAAYILGYDPYADLAVLSADAPESEYHPLEIVSSSTLKVGDLVITVGNPYGLAGSMSVGIISALGRTITEDITGGYPIANVIQTTAPLNPGNSGGPLLNSRGQVIGITTAIISGSQGVSFAIPSNTILREIESLIRNGSYDGHSWLGASGIDMTYEIAKVMGTNVTYGWLITHIVSGGPADRAGLRGGSRITYVAGQRIIVGGDIIVAINGKKITGLDDLSSYLEEYTKPGQRVMITVVRENQLITLEVELGARPPLGQR